MVFICTTKVVSSVSLGQGKQFGFFDDDCLSSLKNAVDIYLKLNMNSLRVRF